jgi:hypothetical protein
MQLVWSMMAYMMREQPPTDGDREEAGGEVDVKMTGA